MRNLYSNATVLWTEREIYEREMLAMLCYQIIKDEWQAVNSVVKFLRVETPILTPEQYLQSHIEAKFPMLTTERGLLRPETTGGTIQAFHALYPMENQRYKKLPICVWQYGKSFRNERNPETMRTSRLRLLEFYQLEFQLFTAHGTKTDYLTIALAGLTEKFGGKIVEVLTQERPHYSEHTLDWEIEGVEVAGCSQRNDWAEGILFEVSIGMDRLLVCTNRQEANDG